MIDKTVFKNISYGMYLVTTKSKQNSGCIINTLTQITSENPLVSISLNKNNYTNEAIKKCQKFAISIISEETPTDIISTFGYNSSREVDKFANVTYEKISGIPVVAEKMNAYLICEVTNTINCETHDIFIARVIEAKQLNDMPPMTYRYYHEVRNGATPKNAPTFISKIGTDSYRCPICGYIYDNSKENLKFEDLPADWVCPLCKVPKEKFEKLS